MILVSGRVTVSRKGLPAEMLKKTRLDLGTVCIEDPELGKVPCSGPISEIELHVSFLDPDTEKKRRQAQCDRHRAKDRKRESVIANWCQLKLILPCSEAFDIKSRLPTFMGVMP